MDYIAKIKIFDCKLMESDMGKILYREYKKNSYMIANSLKLHQIWQREFQNSFFLRQNFFKITIQLSFQLFWIYSNLYIYAPKNLECKYAIITLKSCVCDVVCEL